MPATRSTNAVSYAGTTKLAQNLLNELSTDSRLR